MSSKDVSNIKRYEQQWCVKMDVILDDTTSYKVEMVSGRTINVKLSFDAVIDGINIEF